MCSITVVGCGVMGSRLIQALLNAGIKPVIVDLNKEAAAPFVEQGAVYAPSLNESAYTDCILLNLPHHGIVKSVINGTDPELLKGRMLINTTTSTMSEVREMDEIAKSLGMKHLDAKIECYPGDIGPDTGYLVYAGEKEVFDKTESALKALGTAAYLGSEVTLAAVTDIAVCNVHFGTIGSLLEAAGFCIKTESDVETIIGQIQQILPIMLRGNFRAFQEELKDYDGNFADATECSLEIEATASDTLRNAIQESGVHTPVADTVVDLFRSGIDAGSSKKNVVSVVNQLLK